MSKLNDTIDNLNTASNRAAATTQFYSNVADGDENTTVTNPVSGVETPSFRKMVNDKYQAEDVVGVANAAKDAAEQSATEAAASAASIDQKLNEKTWYDWGTNSQGGNTSIAGELYAFGSGSSRVIVYDSDGGNEMGAAPDENFETESGRVRYNHITNAIFMHGTDIDYDSYLTIKCNGALDARDFPGFDGQGGSSIDAAIAAGYEATDHINSLLADAASVIQNMTYFQSYNKRSAVRIPAGDWIVGEILKPDGVDIIGESPASTRLWGKGGGLSVIKAGVNYVTPLRPSPVEEKLQGRIANISIIGRKDPTYNPLTIAGRVGKSHLTGRGIDLNGAYGQFQINNVDVQYCGTNLYADNSWTLNVIDCRFRFATLFNSDIRGGNLTSFTRTVCTHGNKNWHFDKQSDGESAKCVKMISCDGEHALYEDIDCVNVRQLELDTYYSERNAVRADDPAYTSQISYVSFSNNTPANFGRIMFSGMSVIKSISLDAKNVDLLNIDKAEKVIFSGDLNLQASSVISSAIRFGVEVGDVVISGNVNPFEVPEGVKPVDYTAGSKARVSLAQSFTPYKNIMVNGDLFQWQRAASQTSKGVGSCDRVELFYNGSDNVQLSRQNFLANQETVPAYPRHYARVLSSGAITGNYGVRFNAVPPNAISVGHTLVMGVWMKSSAEANVTLGGVSIFPTIGAEDSNTRTYTVDSAWRFYCLELDMAKGIESPSIDEDSVIQFRIEVDSSFVGSVDFSSVQIENAFPTSIEKVLNGDSLRLCQHYYVAEPLFGVSGGKQYIRFPQPMRKTPANIQLTSGINQPTVTDITEQGFVAEFSGNYNGGYIASAEY
ncbi:hypothetical protein NVP1123O_25 [Vibrio phage 1.123.O._10N.286.48.F3]|nr:hypothetical protein NVP1123O_25 [Vibrio phage 1.123.O._10N.286.48.F3]